MLVLTRKKDQTIVLKDEEGRPWATIVLCEVSGPNTARIGLELDPQVQAVRGEIQDKYPPGVRH